MVVIMLTLAILLHGFSRTSLRGLYQLDSFAHLQPHFHLVFPMGQFSALYSLWFLRFHEDRWSTTILSNSTVMLKTHTFMFCGLCGLGPFGLFSLKTSFSSDFTSKIILLTLFFPLTIRKRSLGICLIM